MNEEELVRNLRSQRVDVNFGEDFVEHFIDDFHRRLAAEGNNGNVRPQRQVAPASPNSNTRTPRRGLASASLAGIKIIPGLVARSSFVLAVTDTELIQNMADAEHYNLVDGFLYCCKPGSFILAASELYKNREELWADRENIYNEFSFWGVHLMDNASRAWNNAIGTTTFDYMLGRQTHQECGISYRAGITNGRFENAAPQRYRWSFAPFTDVERQPALLEHNNQKYGLSITELDETKQNGILRIYSPIHGRFTGQDIASGDNLRAGHEPDEGGEHLEAEYIVVNGRIVAQVNEKPGGYVEIYYYDDSPQQLSPLVRTSMTGAHLAVTREARNELEALWGIIETDALEDIQIGNRTHVRRVYPLSPEQVIDDYELFKFDEDGSLVFHKMELNLVETEYFQQDGLQSSYEKVLQGSDYYWSISKERLEEYLADEHVNMTRESLVAYIEEHGELPASLKDRMTLEVETGQTVCACGVRKYAFVDTVELTDFERTDIHSDDRRDLSHMEMLERNTPRYAVLANPFLRREYATYCCSDTDYQSGVQCLYNSRGHIYHTNCYATNGVSQHLLTIKKYEYQGDPPTLKAILEFDQDGLLKHIQTPNDQIYSPENLQVDSRRNVFLETPEGEKIYLPSCLPALDANGEIIKNRFQKCRRGINIHQQMQFECETAFTSINPRNAERSLQLIRTYEVAKNEHVTQYHMYWSDGGVISGLTIDNSTGACGIYDQEGKLICVDVPINDIEARDTSWINNHESERFQSVANSVLNAQYERLKNNSPDFHDIMAQWFMLSDTQINNYHDSTIARLAQKVFLERYRRDYPEKCNSLSERTTNGFIIDIQSDIERSMQSFAQESVHNLISRLVDSCENSTESNFSFTSRENMNSR